MEIKEAFIKYVQEQIKKYEDIANLVNNNGDIDILALNKALAMYQSLNLSLLAEYQRIKIEAAEIRREYQKWYDLVFVSERRKLMRELESTKTKISVTEIETEVRVSKAQEYNEWQDKLELASHKESFLRRLVEQYKSWQDVLITISHNIRSEMKMMSIENDVDTPDRNLIRKVKQ